MTISDLTNTVWKFNSSVTSPSSAKKILMYGTVTAESPTVKVGSLESYLFDNRDAFYYGCPSGASSVSNVPVLQINTNGRMALMVHYNSGEIYLKNTSVLADKIIVFNSNFNSTYIADDSNLSDFTEWFQDNAVKQEGTGDQWHNLLYNTNGGITIDAIITKSLPSILPTPTREHYTFLGWYTDSSFTTPAIAGATILQDTTLYAKWEDVVYLASASDIISVADAIRSKASISTNLSFPSGFASTVSSIVLSVPEEVSTNSAMESKLVSENIGKAYKFTGTTGTYINGNIYIVESVE